MMLCPEYLLQVARNFNIKDGILGKKKKKKKVKKEKPLVTNKSD